MARNPTIAQRAVIDAILKTWQPQIAKAFEDAVYLASARVDFAAVVDAMQRGDAAALQGLLRLDIRDFAPLREAVRGAYMAGGQSAAASILPQSIAATWGFDGYSPRVLAFVEQHGAALVQGIVDTSQEAVNAAIVDVLAGRDAGGLQRAARSITGTLNRATGRREGGIIGLTKEQADWVINARNDLNGLDARYFTRAKRDLRYDSMLRKAIKDGKPLSPADVDKITGRYKDKLLKMRGETIARNEAFIAQATSRNEAMLQTLGRDDVDNVTVRWQHNLSQIPREDHLAMDGTIISLGETFQFSDASMKYPHDPVGGAKHSVGCRCIAVYRVVLK